MSTENANVTRLFPDIPPHLVPILHEYLIGLHVDTLDLQKAHIREGLKSILPFVVVMYATLATIGVFCNVAVMVHIFMNRLHRDPTFAFCVNLAVSDLIKCFVVLPLSLHVLVVQNWTLGELLCSFLPMLQDIPLHTTTLTFVLIAWDRLQMLRNPAKPRLPAFVCIIGTWLTSVCLVLPYPIYILYVDLGKYVASFQGAGLCVVNLTDDMQEYMRGIFLVMYAGPMATISYIYIKASREIQCHQNNLSVMMFETKRNNRCRTDSHSTTVDLVRNNSRSEGDGISQYSRGSYREHETCRRMESGESEIDIAKEKRTQKYLVTMVTIYAICLCPLMVLRLARLALLETYDNANHFDITYTMFVWIAFLPVVNTPITFVSWQMSRSAKDRLKGYFRFSNRRLNRSCDTVVTTSHSSCVPKCKPVRGDMIPQEELNSDNGSFHLDSSNS